MHLLGYICDSSINDNENTGVMNIEIKNTNGKWLINGKMYEFCSDEEKKFFIEFLNSFRYEE